MHQAVYKDQDLDLKKKTVPDIFLPTQHICLGKKLTSSVCKEWKVAADVGNNKTWVGDADNNNNNNTKQLLIDELEPFTEYKVVVTSPT